MKFHATAIPFLPRAYFRFCGGLGPRGGSSPDLRQNFQFIRGPSSRDISSRVRDPSKGGGTLSFSQPAFFPKPLSTFGRALLVIISFHIVTLPLRFVIFVSTRGVPISAAASYESVRCRCRRFTNTTPNIRTTELCHIYVRVRFTPPPAEAPELIIQTSCSYRFN